VSAWQEDLDDSLLFCCARSTSCDFTGTADEMERHYVGGHRAITATEEIAELAANLTPLGPWAEQSACRAKGVDPTIFDAPTADAIKKHGKDGVAARQREAAAMCAGCPVRAECHAAQLADLAVNDHLRGVIRGGVLFTDRGGEVDLIALAAAGRLTRPAGRGRPIDLPSQTAA
jgi:hypothetical protein